MIWWPFKFHDKIIDVLSNFDSLKKFKFNLQMYVPKGNIIGHFGPLPMNKRFSSTSEMHKPFMPNPNEVKLVTKLNRYKRDTTLMKELFSFEAHIKSYLRWKKWTFGLVLRKFSFMFDFANVHLKVHHDPSFKGKKFQNESCSPRSHLS